MLTRLCCQSAPCFVIVQWHVCTQTVVVCWCGVALSLTSKATGVTDLLARTYCQCHVIYVTDTVGLTSISLVSRTHAECHCCLRQPFNIISLVSWTHCSLVTFVQRILPDPCHYHVESHWCFGRYQYHFTVTSVTDIVSAISVSLVSRTLLISESSLADNVSVISSDMCITDTSELVLCDNNYYIVLCV